MLDLNHALPFTRDVPIHEDIEVTLQYIVAYRYAPGTLGKSPCTRIVFWCPSDNLAVASDVMYAVDVVPTPSLELPLYTVEVPESPVNELATKQWYFGEDPQNVIFAPDGIPEAVRMAVPTGLLYTVLPLYSAVSPALYMLPSPNSMEKVGSGSLYSHATLPVAPGNVSLSVPYVT